MLCPLATFFWSLVHCSLPCFDVWPMKLAGSTRPSPPLWRRRERTISLQSPQQNLLEDCKRWGLFFFFCLSQTLCSGYTSNNDEHYYPESEPSLMIPNYGSDYWVWLSLIICDQFHPFNRWVDWMLTFFEQVCFHIKPRGVRLLWTGWRCLMASLLLWQGGLFLQFLISQINTVDDDYRLPCLTINWEHTQLKTETSLLLELEFGLFLVVSHLHLCSTEKAYGRPSCSQDCASEAHTQSESFCGIVFNICNCFLSVMFFYSKYEFNDHEFTSCTTSWDKKHQIPFTLIVKSRMLKTPKISAF